MLSTGAGIRCTGSQADALETTKFPLFSKKIKSYHSYLSIRGTVLCSSILFSTHILPVSIEKVICKHGILLLSPVALVVGIYPKDMQLGKNVITK